MPVYEYICKSCGEHFQASCGLTDIEFAIKCPKCESNHPDKDRSRYFGKSDADDPDDFTFPT